jgi:hypothetical protein
MASPEFEAGIKQYRVGRRTYLIKTWSRDLTKGGTVYTATAVDLHARQGQHGFYQQSTDPETIKRYVRNWIIEKKAIYAGSLAEPDGVDAPTINPPDFRPGPDTGPDPAPADPGEPSGRFAIRIPVSLHAALRDEADRERVSMNQLVVAKLGVSLAELLRR